MNILKLGLWFCFFCTNLVCSFKFKSTVPLLKIEKLDTVSNAPDNDQIEMREATVGCLGLENRLVDLFVSSHVSSEKFDDIVAQVSQYRKRYYLLLRKNALCVDSPVKAKENIFDQRILALLNQAAEKHNFMHGIEPIGDQDFSNYEGLAKLFES